MLVPSFLLNGSVFLEQQPLCLNNLSSPKYKLKISNKQTNKNAAVEEDDENASRLFCTVRLAFYDAPCTLTLLTFRTYIINW